MAALLRTLLDEPAVPDPPRRVWRDWVLLAVAYPTVVVEGIVNVNATWRPFSTVLALAFVTMLLWRRTHPLAVLVGSLAFVMIAERLSQALYGEPFEYYSVAFVLLVPYALFRWASGRHMAIGLGLMVVMLVSMLAGDWTGIGDAIGGTLVFFFPAGLGLEVRQIVGNRERDREQVKLRERELLARELHDTVAHHVSAIAIRAQAGRVVGSDDPAGALDALAVIEQEASRTLAEMRSIVGTLRGTDPAELAPQPRLDDLRGLADPAPSVGNERQLVVNVTIADDVGDVGTAVETALYRLSQEAITNARRHARDATLVSVDVGRDGDAVRLIVHDDGRPSSQPTETTTGYGLVGMTERAHLLGGTLTAGPCTEKGWRVEASIPRQAVGR
ncbi:sensor histidine kinase [Ilumatobacter nonamiensis]|uniref:sensor histidine kinase n=1 Tax=Ilumatobacter nonamiensis TaxID=467093 RepID=UPI00034B2167|nr:sensor histidine kinase [Ilumatobacter nonamiensis]